MILSQTLAGNWVITVANPEEDGWETELANFALDSTGPDSPAREALLQATAAAFCAMVQSLNNPMMQISIVSHDRLAQAAMRLRCANLGVTPSKGDIKAA
jgi:hypothetical protein